MLRISAAQSIRIQTFCFTPDALGALVQHLQACRGQVRYTGLGYSQE
jgi:hypothetical protein